jgi:hypothetical protein
MAAHDSLSTGHEPEIEPPKGIRGSREFRALLNAAGGAIPFVGGLLAAGAGAWPNRNRRRSMLFSSIGSMLQAEMAEKIQTIL